MTRSIQLKYRAAPGRVVCKMLDDVIEEGRFELADGKINLVAEVADIGDPLDQEDSRIASMLAPGMRIVLPRVKGQMHDGHIAIRLQDINIIVDYE